MKKLTALLLLLPVFALAEPGGNPLRKKDNPDELQYYTSIGPKGSCPISRVALEEIVRGVFVRSRIKPARWNENDTSNRELYLFVDVSCYDPPEIYPMFFYNIEAGFGERMEVRDRSLPVRFFVNKHYGSIGVVDDSGLRSRVKSRVEEAMTDYLKANFNLGEDE
jgi:hypothetical protein